MDTIVKVITKREDYDIRDSAENALTIEETIEILKYLPPKAKIVFSNDNGYTFARGEELAEFEDYINRLCDDGLIKYDKTNDKGIKIYSITKKGYDFAHTLPMYDDNNNLIHR